MKKRSKEKAAGDGHQMPSWREVFLYFLFLGFVNVGGPVAQITMMYNHMVERRKWLTEDRFVKIMAFCHADWSRSTPIVDLRRLFETQVVGRNPGGSHIHFAGRDRDDRFELAVREVWQAAASQ